MPADNRHRSQIGNEDLEIGELFIVVQGAPNSRDGRVSNDSSYSGMVFSYVGGQSSTVCAKKVGTYHYRYSSSLTDDPDRIFGIDLRAGWMLERPNDDVLRLSGLKDPHRGAAIAEEATKRRPITRPISTD